MKKRGRDVENVRQGEVVNEEDWVVCLCAHLCTQKSRVHTAYLWSMLLLGHLGERSSESDKHTNSGL